MRFSLKAYLALLVSVLLWAFLVIIARGTASSIPPMLFFLIRFLVATIAFFPFFIRNKPWKKKHFGKLIAVSLLSTMNVAFFMWGIQFTSASASQVIYAAIPVLILVINYLFFKEKYPIRKIAGVVLGFSGILLIVYLSAIERGTTITGTLVGNLAMIVAMTSWMFYIIFSKKISKDFSPSEIGSVSIITSFIMASFLAYLERIFFPVKIRIDQEVILASFYMGFFGTFLTYLLYQYAIKHTSALTASLTSYIQPVTTAILAMIFLGERLTLSFVFGGMMVFLGVFLTATLEFYQRKKQLAINN